MTNENNLTAHFNKWNLMSKGKESSHNVLSYSGFKEKQRANYHSHHPNIDKDIPEAFTLEPQFNTKLSISINKDEKSRKNSFYKNLNRTPKNYENKENLANQQSN